MIICDSAHQATDIYIFAFTSSDSNFKFIDLKTRPTQFHCEMSATKQCRTRLLCKVDRLSFDLQKPESTCIFREV